MVRKGGSARPDPEARWIDTSLTGRVARAARRARWGWTALVCVSFVSAMTLGGCGNPGEGTVKIDPGVRSKIGQGPPVAEGTPPPKADGKGPLMEPGGIKGRGRGVGVQ
jgi:hypothetical protein